MNDADFTRIDSEIFDRLHWGSLEPLTISLKDGTQVTGRLLAVHRAGAIGSAGGTPSGEICLDVASGTTSVRYDQISEIE